MSRSSEIPGLLLLRVISGCDIKKRIYKISSQNYSLTLARILIRLFKKNNAKYNARIAVSKSMLIQIFYNCIVYIAV